MSKKVSNSQKEYQTHEKPKRPNWGAKRGPFCISQHLLLQNIQKSEGGPFGEKFRKKISVPKKTERGDSLSRYCMLRGKRGKTFLVQFAMPNDAIWGHEFP